MILETKRSFRAKNDKRADVGIGPYGLLNR